MSDKPSSSGPVGGGEDEVCQLGDPSEETGSCPLSPSPSAGGSGSVEVPEPADKPGALGEARTGRLAALIYIGISLLAAIVFIAATILIGGYPAVASYGGAAWVFLLMMIVLMPFVIPRVRKWRG